MIVNDGYTGWVCVECSGQFWTDEQTFEQTANGPVCKTCLPLYGIEPVDPKVIERYRDLAEAV